MTLQEYQNYAHGYFLRLDRGAIPLRRIYTLIYNSKVARGKQLISPEAVMNQWPLLTDQRTVDQLSAEDKKRRLEKAIALTAKQRRKPNANEQ